MKKFKQTDYLKYAPLVIAFILWDLKNRVRDSGSLEHDVESVRHPADEPWPVKKARIIED
ncbi:hypothetical protein [Paenibacillus silviterrae]|jgi:hypothetical protein|uniref:hypothetical protein n=1 Tax=Paenibacillus silviterrae TaxID=3242194 RepID=UPI0025437D40|nr:hypothetical protein [Paenibacillus chinjuensis]